MNSNWQMDQIQYYHNITTAETKFMQIQICNPFVKNSFVLQRLLIADIWFDIQLDKGDKDDDKKDGDDNSANEDEDRHRYCVRTRI